MLLAKNKWFHTHTKQVLPPAPSACCTSSNRSQAMYKCL